MDKKIKILTLSDHPFSPSGVGTQTKYIIEGMLATGKYQFISLPDVYYDRTLPVSFDVVYFLGVPIISFVIVCLASYYPARGASRLTPLEGIRDF